ncbi:MAG: DNA helicase UvrD [Candidatus Levybacteria bacterium]|nr:DNA helicase UvrD [Candidatus Levybacteria bacterium]
MEIIADLHLHSKYSRAVSKDMNLPTMAFWATKKGLNLLSTGDWTHPMWIREIKQSLEEAQQGLFRLKTDKTSNMRFLLSVEVSSIYSQGGKVRRIHNLIFSPNIETCEKINQELIKRGCNLGSDGRPIIGLSSINLCELVFSIDEHAMVIPCHIYTPWFSMFGSNSGFDSVEECFGEFAREIYGVETGLSSDPYMNWQIKDLGNRSILSFSDAHSPAKMGREATVFMTREDKTKEITYKDISDAIKKDPKAKFKIGYTIEFYPEEGKYHYTGHRNCNYFQTPDLTRKEGTICPVCKKPLTVGVMHRVEDLAKRGFSKEVSKLNNSGVKWIVDPSKIHPPFVKLVPLNEIIAESLSSTVSSLRVKELFDKLCLTFGSEINVLLKVPIDDIKGQAGEKVAQGVEKVRKGEIVIHPGYDGLYGVVKIWNEEENKEKLGQNIISSQLGIDF